MEFRTRFTKPVKLTKDFKGKSRTHQSMKAETDINNIMRKYAKTGVLTHVTQAIPQFGDVSHIGDYKTAMEQVLHAQELFQGLPSRVRERFANDPSNFMTFMSKAENVEEAIKLGLAIERPKQTEPSAPLNTTQQPTNG